MVLHISTYTPIIYNVPLLFLDFPAPKLSLFWCLKCILIITYTLWLKAHLRVIDHFYIAALALSTVYLLHYCKMGFSLRPRTEVKISFQTSYMFSIPYGCVQSWMHHGAMQRTLHSSEGEGTRMCKVVSAGRVTFTKSQCLKISDVTMESQAIIPDLDAWKSTLLHFSIVSNWVCLCLSPVCIDIRQRLRSGQIWPLTFLLLAELLHVLETQQQTISHPEQQTASLRCSPYAESINKCMSSFISFNYGAVFWIASIQNVSVLQCSCSYFVFWR